MLKRRRQKLAKTYLLIGEEINFYVGAYPKIIFLDLRSVCKKLCFLLSCNSTGQCPWASTFCPDTVGLWSCLPLKHERCSKRLRRAISVLIYWRTALLRWCKACASLLGRGSGPSADALSGKASLRKGFKRAASIWKGALGQLGKGFGAGAVGEAFWGPPAAGLRAQESCRPLRRAASADEGAREDQKC